MLMAKWCFGFILVLLCPVAAFCQSVAIGKDVSTDQVSAAQKQPFTNQLRNTIAFLHTHYVSDNNETKEIDGTGFFLAVPDARLPKEKTFLYLVTNRHMAAPDSHLGLTRRVVKYDVLLNTINKVGDHPDVQAKTFELKPGLNASWYFPEDKSIDLAVLPVVLDIKSISFQEISISDIATDDVRESAKVAPGYQVVFAGYFYQFPGAKKIQPIVRQGVLAMLPDDPIPTVIENRRGTVFLVDAHSYHGNSGSPAFVNIGGIHGGSLAGDSYKLLGVVSGYYPEYENGALSNAMVLTGAVHDNSGITILVPGDQLKSLLNSGPLQTIRDRDSTSKGSSQSTEPCHFRRCPPSRFPV